MRAKLLLLTGAIFAPMDAYAADVGRALPVSFSPIDMFLQADIVVKAVMIALAAASFAAWVILFAKKIELARLSRSVQLTMKSLGGARHLADALQRDADGHRIGQALLRAAGEEVAFGAHDRSALNERIGLRFQRIEAAALREAGKGLGVLATIGSTAPFIGLFGTVWGIMNSFIGIAKTQTTNLAVVAPGIAEALLATAIGLVAAVPAVIFYNHLARALLAYKNNVTDVATLVSILVGREAELSTRRTAPAVAAE